MRDIEADGDRLNNKFKVKCHKSMVSRSKGIKRDELMIVVGTLQETLESLLQVVINV